MQVGEHMQHTTRGKVQVMTRGTEKAKMEDPGGCTRPPALLCFFLYSLTSSRGRTACWRHDVAVPGREPQAEGWLHGVRLQPTMRPAATVAVMGRGGFSCARAVTLRGVAQHARGHAEFLRVVEKCCCSAATRGEDGAGGVGGICRWNIFAWNFSQLDAQAARRGCGAGRSSRGRCGSGHGRGTPGHHACCTTVLL